jgi:MFS family permease
MRQPFLSVKNKVPSQIFVIGMASAFIAFSSATFFSVFALFLKHIGRSYEDIGQVEGLIEGMGFLLKMASGVVSDYLKKKKAVFAAGAIFIALTKPLVFFFMSFKIAILARVCDRIGNGIQATPRDALISDYAPKNGRGASFGIRQGLGTIGSIMGSLVAIYVLRNSGFSSVFMVSSIPAVFAFFIITFFIKDSQRPATENIVMIKTEQAKFRLKDIGWLPKEYWLLMVIVGVFMVCRFGESFLILYGQKAFSLRDDSSIQIMLVYNISAAFSAFLTGYVIDKFSNKTSMIVGILIMFCADVTIVLASIYPVFLVGTVLWGVQMGLMQNVFCANIAAIVPANLRGTGFGIFYFVTAISLYSANIIAGNLMIHGSFAFLYSAVVALIACVLTVILKKNSNDNTQKS